MKSGAKIMFLHIKHQSEPSLHLLLVLTVDDNVWVFIVPIQKYIMNLSNIGTLQNLQDTGYEILGPSGSFSPIINCSLLSPPDGLVVRQSGPACSRGWYMGMQPRLIQGHARLPDLWSYTGRKLRQLMSPFFSVLCWSSYVLSHCASGRGKGGKIQSSGAGPQGRGQRGVMGVLFGIICIYNGNTVLTLGYCPSTAFITVFTEATLPKYGLLPDVMLFDKLRTQISAFFGEPMLNCCKQIQI